MQHPALKLGAAPRREHPPFERCPAKSLVRVTLASMRVPLSAEILAARAAARPLAPHRPRRRHDACPASCSGSSIPAALDRLARAAAARLGARLRDERQDDDGRDGRRDPPPHVRARAQRVGREPRVGRRLDAARARRAPSSGSSRSTRPRCPRSRGASGRARVCLGNLFRDQLDRYGELELVAERWRGAVAALPAGARARRERRRPAGRRARARRGRARLVFGLDDPRHARPSLQHAADSKYCVSCGTPYEYAAAYVGHLGDYRCPACGHARPPLDVVARDIELRGLDGAAFSLVTPDGDAARAASRARASTTSTTRSPRRRSRARSASRSTTSWRGSSASARRSAASSASQIGDRRAADAADQEPGRRERGDPHARRGRRAAARASSR